MGGAPLELENGIFAVQKHGQMWKLHNFVQKKYKLDSIPDKFGLKYLAYLDLFFAIKFFLETGKLFCGVIFLPFTIWMND